MSKQTQSAFCLTEGYTAWVEFVDFRKHSKNRNSYKL